VNVEELIAEWGYLAVFLAACMEGETVMLLAGIASGAGLLWWPLATLCGATGTFLGSQAWYVMGRVAGPRVIEMRPGMRDSVEKVQGELERRGVWLFVFYRFLYGLRAVTPFALGVSGVPPWKYVPIDAVCWLVWLSAVSGLGWWLGEPALAVFEQIAGAGSSILTVAFGLLALAYLGSRWRRSRDQPLES
jgi:membrane protein DedA with SNARE-associated domain